MSLKHAKTLSISFSVLFVSLLHSQQDLRYFLPDVSYNRSIPTPESFFGFQVGEWHLTPDQIHAYMKAVDAASDRVTVEEFGRTYEQRPMILLTISSPENHRNLATLKEQHHRLSDPSASSGLNTAEMPVVVWMGYSVHGNEPSGANASVLVAYYLAAAQGPEIEKILKNSIILLNPSINPDGLNRFATWANMHRGRQPVGDPMSREHQEVWPGGRTNHYWFDLNRDWMPAQLPETRGRLAKYYEWMPNILTDHHEMGTNSTFFFQPGVATRENPLTPSSVRELTARIARFHAQGLDSIRSLYYSEEGYDDFYIGKGSSYPDITGGIGILFEQASSRGYLQESSYGPVRFPFTIRNQVTTSLTTIKAAQELRGDLLNHQREFFASALKDAERSPVKAYVFGSRNDPWRTSFLIDILLSHHIQVHSLGRSISSDGRTFEPSWSYVVPVVQPQSRILTSLFEQRTSFRDSLFYDISSWTLPSAFAVPSAEIRSLDRASLGAVVATPPRPAGSFSSGSKDYAYVFEWHSYFAPRSLNRLLKAGVKARVASKPFTIATSEGSHRFDEGSILIPLGIQQEKSDTINALLSLAALQDGVHVYAMQTGLSGEGIDLGSADFASLQAPSVALLAGPGVSSGDIGEAWHLLDQRMQMEPSLLEPQALGRARLDRYNVMVMASGSYGSIDSSGKEALRRWVGEGGTLIGMEQGAEWLIQNKIGTAKLRTDERTKKDSTVEQRPYGDEEDYSQARSIPGSIFDVRYDRTHPLLYGYGDDPLKVFRSTSVFLEPSKSAYGTPVQYTDKPLVSGYLHKEQEKLVKNSAAVLVTSLRSGRVILLSDNPNFREFWFGTNKLFLNGIFFGSTIRASSTRAPGDE